MKTTRWTLRALIMAFTFSISVPVLGEESETFQYSRTIDVPDDVQEELCAVPLDSEIYAATRDGFPDLRVLDEAQRSVPFLIRKVSESRTKKIRTFWAATDPALKPLGDNGMEIRVTLKKDDPSPNGLQFITPLRNFEQQVQVFAISEGSEQQLVDGALIFDYAQFMDVRRPEVEFPTTTAREFRIVVDKLTSDQESQLLQLSRSLKGGSEQGRTEETTIERRPFRIDRIEFWREQTEEIPGVDADQTWPVSDLKVTQDPEHKQTLLEFTSRREPLTDFKIVTDSRNFSRRAEVQIDADSTIGSKWKTLTSATISQFQLQDFHEEHVTVHITETRRERYRVVIHNGDSPELPVKAIEATGCQYQLVFLNRPGLKAQLVYGSESATPPQHDTVALTTALAKHISPVAATLGVQSQAIAASQKPVDVKSLLNNPIALGAIIAVLVIALGWGLYQAGQRIDQMPHEDAK
ncbi:MAG TPA: hypothetical protein PK992_01930 [Planctomycetaceae bacterium]|nr:hypothetical protein [Planctomycetaceae bacterium]